MSNRDNTNTGGPMISNAVWQPAALGDLVSIQHGWAFKGELFSEELSGLPIVVNIGNFKYTGGFRFEETTLKEYRGSYPRDYELSAGDILLVMTCQTAGGEILGIPARVPNDDRVYLHNQRLGKVVIRRPDLVDPSFLYWVFLWSEFNRELVVSASGTKILHTSPSRIEAFKFDLPPLEEQRAIANILGSLDDKIEANRRMNETLEATARAIFKSWFVDFDPVHTKSRGETPPGMDAETAALFPDTFEDSELGPIPSGWRVGTLGEVSEKPQYGYTTSAVKEDIGPKFLRIMDINKTPWIEWETVPHCEVDDTNHWKYKLSRGDVVIARMADPGHGALIEEDVDAIFASYLIRFRPKHGDMARYIQYWLRSDLFWQQVEAIKTGTTRPSLNAQVLSSFKLVIPPNGTGKSFSEAVSILRDQLVLNNKQSRILSETRDALLPKLISGEVRVGESS